LETADNRTRLQWLQQLQSNRRRHYEKENVDDLLKVKVDSADEVVVVAGPPDQKSLEDEILDATQSTFYLDSDGELNARSLEMPAAVSPNTDILKNAEEIIGKIAEETQAAKARVLEHHPAKKVIDKAKASLRLHSSNSPGPPRCEQCEVLLGVVNTLKDRCYELTDEVGANQDLVAMLRQNLLKSNRQVELLTRMEELKNPQERISLILEKESELTACQLNAASYSREIQFLMEQNKQYEEKIEEMNIEIEAFRESVRSKEELIMKFCGEQEGNATLGRPVALLEDGMLGHICS
uniref:Shootin-1 n=1 Tax=Gongylonema pulchrum TaxID=637853 RepID=A0A183EJ20_9BILA